MGSQASRTSARACALVLVAAALAGCGGGSSQHHAVDAYVDDVNSIMTAEQHELTGVQIALNGFSATTPKEQKALRRAVATCDRLVRRVRALEPPAAATDVQRRLEGLLTADRDAAAAARDLNAFLAAQRGPQARVHAAELRLSRAIRIAHGAAAQRAAFSAFAADVRSFRQTFARLPAHGAAAAWRHAEVARLGRLAAAAQSVAAALDRHDANAMREGLARLQDEIRGADAVLAERHAVAVYERLVRRVTRDDVALAKARAALRRAVS
ncbi:MAG TPA: hypothetical protein VI408_14195 [Gaiellaceae bacterium]